MCCRKRYKGRGERRNTERERERERRGGRERGTGQREGRETNLEVTHTGGEEWTEAEEASTDSGPSGPIAAASQLFRGASAPTQSVPTPARRCKSYFPSQSSSSATKTTDSPSWPCVSRMRMPERRAAAAGRVGNRAPTDRPPTSSGSTQNSPCCSHLFY